MMPPVRLVGVVLVSIVLSAISGDGPANASQAELRPTIVSVEPNAPSEWSTIRVYGSNLRPADASCGLLFSGVPAYVIHCSDTEMLAVTPWISGETSVTVRTSDGESDGLVISLAPRVSAEMPYLVPGEVVIHSTRESEPSLIDLGIADSAVVSLVDASPVLASWYSVQVPPGQEIELSREFSSLAGIDYAGPASYPTTADIPGDEYYPEQWYLSQIDAPSAWTISKGDSAKSGLLT